MRVDKLVEYNVLFYIIDLLVWKVLCYIFFSI